MPEHDSDWSSLESDGAFWLNPWLVLAVFGVLLVAFHVGEWLVTCAYNRDQLGCTSCLLTPAYIAVMALCIAEHVAWTYAVPQLKGNIFCFAVGLAGAVLGDAVRKVAMISAQHNFTHQIRVGAADLRFDQSAEKQHTLMTRGVYSCCRHPGYWGFFLWVVALQVMLANPLSLVLQTVVIFVFFSRRIAFEERMLEQQLSGYAEYKRVTPTCIPCIA
jgi:protein-S-isoprenylcysteine O-methyltransferase